MIHTYHGSDFLFSAVVVFPPSFSFLSTFSETREEGTSMEYGQFCLVAMFSKTVPWEGEQRVRQCFLNLKILDHKF